MKQHLHQMSRGRDVDEDSSRRLQDETVYLAELVAGKSELELQQYTLYNDSGEQGVVRRSTDKRSSASAFIQALWNFPAISLVAALSLDKAGTFACGAQS
ncbi:hypothetical protein KFY49_25195 [Salmonella enterica subsp. enterica serovar 1,4,[5],12:i:-]|nr:hypothetical protein [Salmonella enterica subsp. enterica serovar 1,4,[5],12:i:-]